MDTTDTYDLEAAARRSPDIALAIQAERKRCISLLELAGPGFEAIVQEAIESGASVGETAIRIATVMKDRGVTLAQIAADAPPAVTYAGTPSDGKPGAWAAVTEKFKQERSE